MDKQEYNRIMGLDTEDIGSRRLLLSKVIEYAKEKGYKTSAFYKMGKEQLYAIYQKRIALR